MTSHPPKTRRKLKQPHRRVNAFHASFKSIPDQLVPFLECLLGAVKSTPEGYTPDWSTRLNAMKLAIAYEVGLPIERMEVSPREQTDGTEVQERLLTNPNYRNALRLYLDSIEHQPADLESPDVPEQDADQPTDPTEMEG